MPVELISVRQCPIYGEEAVAYFQSRWGNADSQMVYADCIRNALHTTAPLPQWYLLKDGEQNIGGAGLIPNDFISRMDLWPWLCALYIEPAYRGHAYGKLLVERAKADSRRAGFSAVYLCTDHIGYYERYGFSYIGDGFHPWGECSRIYEAKV